MSENEVVRLLMKVVNNSEMPVTWNQKLLTVNEVCEILRLKKSSVYNLIGSPDCPFEVRRIGNSIRVVKSSLYEYIEGNNRQMA